MVNELDELKKIADMFEQQTSKDLFGAVSYREEAKQLSLMAGKLHYRAREEKDAQKGKQLADIAKMVLSAADMLKRV